MFYNGKNVTLKVNNQLIAATEAQISYEAQISPYLEVGQRHANEIRVDNTIQGSLNFSYHYTGIDPIKNLLSLDEGVSFDFGGIKQTGYIRSYNARFSPHNPVVCSTEILFFSSPTGTFSPIYDNGENVNNVVHINNISISNFNNQNLTGSYLSASYNYSTDIRPEIYIGDTFERRGVFGLKETILNITCDNLNPLVEISGTRVGVVLGVSPFGASLVTQGYAVTGFLTKKAFQAKNEEFLVNELTIRQFNLLDEATISSFSPTSGAYKDSITINGTNFNYVTKVFFGEYEADRFTINNSNTITAVVPRINNTVNQQIRMLTLA
jgi:hypothetical protein